ncbi:D-alanyl-D-alanine carboxypeptidase PBP3 [Streptococcus halichoeri]|uniref:D-alanyl-D-alanine carboxypeptidase PBP3 n=1 Tax=Streptococcus halichoeri TaxID=254785 RepID=UPI00135757CE|nr:D-alanyl-D-alanine carboxypeptidase PBP3 [Streptococcus halichoeri]
MIKQLTCLLVLMLFFAANATQVQAQSQVQPIPLAAESGFAFEAATGKILFEKNSNKALPVASISKVVTAYLVYQEVQKGHLKWDSPVSISNYPYWLTSQYHISNVPLDKRQYSVLDLLTAMLVTNANSPAIALAEAIAGTEDLFVKKMNQQLKAWGATDSKLINASGLANEELGEFAKPQLAKTAENQMSASDVAIATYHLLKDFPQVTQITSQASATFAGQTIFSYNYLLPGMPYARKGSQGLFLGTSAQGLSSLVTSSTEGDLSIVTVLLNVDQGKDKPTERFQVANRFLDEITKQFQKVTILKKGQSLRQPRLTVKDSPDKLIPLEVATTLTAVQPRVKGKKLTYQVNKTQAQYFAPLAKHQTVASITLVDQNNIGRGYMGKMPQTKLVTQKAIPRSFFLKVWWNHWVDYVNQNL